MALTVVPDKVFDELTSPGITEDEEGVEKFNFQKFEKFMDLVSLTYKKEGIFDKDRLVEDALKRYMKRFKEIKYAGVGSSRIAFFFPPGYVTDNSAPCCLKIAKNLAGIAQNKAELDIVEKYGDLPCFPRFYKPTPKTGTFVVTEFGKKVTPAFEKKYCEAWNDQLRTYTTDEKFLDRLEDTTGLDHPFLALKFFFIKSVDAIVMNMFDFDEHDLEIILGNVLSPIVRKNSQFQVISGIARMTIDGGMQDMGIEDFYNRDNWAIVVRDKKRIPIPIDWGFTETVQASYYS